MSNYDLHTVGIFQDDLETVKEYLNIAINTIFFHRWLNNINYTSEKSSINNISYIKMKDFYLKDNIKSILNKISSLSPSSKNFQINLTFYTNKTDILFGWFQRKEIWEKWNILVIVSEKGSKDKENNVRKFINIIINELNSEKDFMPDINLPDFDQIDNMGNNINKNGDFPYEIKVNKEFEQDSMIKIFKKNSFNRID